MAFPAYVHSVVRESDGAYWPIQQQGVNECGCTAPANALNLLAGWKRFEKDDFVRQAGLFFQRQLGGSPSPITGWLIRRQGYGTHFGHLRADQREVVLRALIDLNVPVVLELGINRVGPFAVFGQHSVVLVGYSDRFTDAQATQREEYYFIDAQYPQDGTEFGLHTNDVDRDGDGLAESYPGNRTIARDLFLRDYPTGIYFPVFPTQAEHDGWYSSHLRPGEGKSLIRKAMARILTGSRDEWSAA